MLVVPCSDVPASDEERKAQEWLPLMGSLRTDTPRIEDVKFPLYVQGRHVVDSVGQVIRLKGVNWYGAHMEQFVNNGLDKRKLEDLVRILKTLGFNSVRLNYGVKQFMTNPTVNERFVSMNPALKGQKAMDIFDACVEAITSAGLLVIINNHVSSNRWCRSLKDTNSLWYNEKFDEDKWLDSLSGMAQRYKKNPRVIGYDIRNEPRPDMSTKDEVTALGWNPPTRTAADWRKASIEGSKAVWRGNPEALVFIEGLGGASHWFATKDGDKIEFAQPCLNSRIAYSAHGYPWVYGDDFVSLRISRVGARCIGLTSWNRTRHQCGLGSSGPTLTEGSGGISSSGMQRTWISTLHIGLLMDTSIPLGLLLMTVTWI